MSKKMPYITVEGDGFAVGKAHARATLHLRDLVAGHAERVRREYGAVGSARELENIQDVIGVHSPDTLLQVEGMAEVYELDSGDMLMAVLQTYFEGLRRETESADQGCTTYGYSSPAGCVLVKNRDTSSKFLNAQTVIDVTHQDTHRWIALSTAGAPGVHSAGMNERGLSIADTHVPSRDSGPGLPRFSMMMNLLQRCANVHEALAYYRETPSMGYGNLVLQDADGEQAVIECGFSRSHIHTSDTPIITATNHFVSPEMAPSGLDDTDSAKGQDTRKRKELLSRELEELQDGVLSEAIAPMKHHEDAAIGSICVHEHFSPTIATIAMYPRKKYMEIAHGNPCISPTTRFVFH